MVVASGLLVVVIGAAFLVLLLAVDDLRDTTRLSRHSQEVLATANQLERLLVDLETGERGFLITGQERFLQPWEAARSAIPGAREHLLALTQVPAQHRRARQIAEGVTSYLRDYSKPLVVATRRNEPAARSLAESLEGKRRVDLLRAQFDRLSAAEDLLGATRQTHSESAARKAVVAVTAGLAGSVLLILFFAGYLTRSIVQPVRRAATMADRLAGGDLTVRMDETGAGEIGTLEHAFNTMGGSLEASRDELRLLVEEQAALRRVATLVARAVPPAEVFDAVTIEVAQLLGAHFTVLLRYESDRTHTVLGVRGNAGAPVAVGDRPKLEERSVVAAVLRTGRATRMDNIADGLSGALAGQVRERGLHSAIGAPIVVEGRLWGVMVAAWTRGTPLSADTEGRLAEFTQLVATAVANVNSRAELAASRARVVAAADETRRRIERDLHDGAQQRLVSLALELRSAQSGVPPGLAGLERQLSAVADGLAEAVENLQEISRGIHPAILTEGGLAPALKTLARRSAVPVELDMRTDRRLPEQVERAAYYVVSEALTNAAKHARASVVHLEMETDDEIVTLSIRDDGVGGADPRQGSGLIGLTDRVEALGGRIQIASPSGTGTSLQITIPIRDSS
jgi:signal transduction histidine kinase